MSKSYKFLLYFIGFLVFVVIVYLIIKGLTSTPANPPAGNTGNNQNNQQNLPDYILSDQDEAGVKEFVKNFINLYNTYRYQDFSNLTALGDYQTPAFQQKTIDLVSQLEQSTPMGFSKITVADSATFSYKYPKANLLEVTMQADVSETVGEGSQNGIAPRSSPSSSSYRVSVQVELVPNGKNWLVNDFMIQKLKQ